MMSSSIATVTLPVSVSFRRFCTRPMSWRTIENISAKATAVPSLFSSPSARSASSMIFCSLILASAWLVARSIAF